MEVFNQMVYTVWGISAVCVVVGLVMFLIGCKFSGK